MSFVLAINAGLPHDRVVDQLTQEFAGREFVMVSSSAEALDVIERRVPDLVVFPVSVSPAAEVDVLHRLYGARSDDPRRLAMPMQSLATAGASSPRWFYWFKPESIRSAEDARRFTDGLRDQLQPVPAPARPQASAFEAPPVAAVSLVPPVVPPVVPPAGTTPVPSLIVEAEDLSFTTPPPAVPTVEDLGALAAYDDSVPEPDAPTLWSRVVGVIRRGRDAADDASAFAAPVGNAVRRWAPRAVAAAVILAAGVVGRSYWLTLVPRIEEATRLAAAATAPTARAEATVTPVGGSLSVTSEPNGATVLVDGQLKGMTPLTIDGLAPGTHAVVVKSGQGTVERSVVVKLNQTATLDASIYSGWLAVFSPIEIQIFDGKRLVRLDERNRVMLSPGRHELRFSNKTLGYEERRVVQMKPGELTPLTVVPPKSTISVSTSAPAEVWIDGTRVGDTPVVDWPVEIGTREVVLRGQGEHRLTVTATVTPLRLNVDLSTPSRPGA